MRATIDLTAIVGVVCILLGVVFLLPDKTRQIGSVFMIGAVVLLLISYVLERRRR